MDCDVFERYELKYLVNRQQREAMKELLSLRMDKDAFGDHGILSLYYDTPDYRIIRRSIEKPVYKEKLRLRSYGVPSIESKVYVEMKIKCNGIVYKRRISMPLGEAHCFLAGKKEPASQIGREIACCMERYAGIRPAMLVTCAREAYFGTGDEKSVRVTFDMDIRYRAKGLDLMQDTPGVPLIGRNAYLMEVKLPGVMPLWLAHSLDKLKIYPCSFSKYGAAFEDCCAAENSATQKEVIRCA